mgnify:FL=1
MKTEQVKLTQVKANAANPRTITSDKFTKLVNSILVFPKMLELRPIVVDNKMLSLGGNMRGNALKAISKMTPEEVATRLSSLADFQSKSKVERDKLVEYWGKWLEAPFAYIIKASELTEDEKKQFIVKDNVSYGQWDYDLLANTFDNKKLEDWGMDVWNAAPVAFTPIQPAASNNSSTPSQPDESEDDGKGAIPAENLPPELQGLDLNPNELPKLQGDDATPMERIIITYPKDRLPELLALLGMASIDKVVYRIDEIIPD